MWFLISPIRGKLLKLLHESLLLCGDRLVVNIEVATETSNHTSQTTRTPARTSRKTEKVPRRCDVTYTFSFHSIYNPMDDLT